MKISVLCSDTSHPVYPHLRDWATSARTRHAVELVQRKAKLTGGDILFLISCHEIISIEDRRKYVANLVIHASDLPKGRGWSPHVWQILEGSRDVVVSLIEAQDEVDTGAIWAQRHLVLEGHELYEEINNRLFAIELELMDDAVGLFGHATPVPQEGLPSHYPRRKPEDSRLDPDRSIAEQFDLLRVADPKRFPAFFDLRGHRYLIHVEKAGAADE